MLSFSVIAPLIPKTSGKIYIAYSGGIDSQVLLHLCASQADLRKNLIAVYVHHGLQAVADDWETHCLEQAQTLGVEFLCLKVNAKAKNGESPEAAAREARYDAFRQLLQIGDLLLLAQHREDQLETLLLQLFRGAGVQGMAAMPDSCAFGKGTMVRPLLNTAKADIQAYADTYDLLWVEDPTNQSHDFDRNYLRNAVVPLLKQRWPSLDKTVSRSAAHCAQASELLNDWGQIALAQLIVPENNSLATDKLQAYSDAQINWLLRLWLQSFGLKPPSRTLLQAIKQQLITARSDAGPQIAVQGYMLKKFRHHLFCLHPKHLSKPEIDYDWPAGQASLTLPNGHVLIRAAASTGIVQGLWHQSKVTLRARSGGEKLKLPGRDGSHCLKKLYQEAGIPPWERDARPLLYLNDRLAAVPNLWIAEWAWSQEAGACYQLTWKLAESM